VRRILSFILALGLVGSSFAEANAEPRPAAKRSASRKKAPKKKPTPKPSTELPPDAPPPWLLPAAARTVPLLRPAGGLAPLPPPARPTERTITAALRAGDAASTRTIKLTVAPRGEGAHALLTLAQGDRVTQSLAFDLDVSPGLALSSLEVIDLDLDGHKDVRVLREHGAKWTRSEVFLYDAKAGRLTQTALAKKLSSLPNLEVDAARRELVSTTLGPEAPSHAAYVVERGELTLAKECVFKMRAAGRGTLTVRERAAGAGLRTRRYDDIEVPAAFPRACDVGAR
jgi:hypothetical protein